MHFSSMQHMERLVQQYLPYDNQLTILDIGSYDVNGSYKPLLTSPKWSYTGIDLAAGPNVDLALTSPYQLPLPDEHADVVISGQAFEHIEFFWLTWIEIERVLKPGGYVFLIAPSRGPEHGYPVDCWRYYPDGFRALAKYAKLELIEVGTDWDAHEDQASAAWGDTVGVFRKPIHGWRGKLKHKIRARLHRLLIPF